MRLGRAGTVISDARSGADRPLTQQPARQVVVLASGGTQTAVNRLGGSALAARFERTGAATFHRASGNGVLILIYTATVAVTVAITQQ